VEQIRALGVTVVTQPGLVRSRGDRYLEDVEAEDQPDLWRLGSLQRAGVAVAAGSDAPYGPADVWAAVEAAVTRRTACGRLLGPGEAVSPAAALALFHGRADDPARLRSVRPGQPGDVCVTGPSGVEATIIAGRLAYRR
jgi:predicted amidohydrolase YtcJ